MTQDKFKFLFCERCEGHLSVGQTKTEVIFTCEFCGMYTAMLGKSSVIEEMKKYNELMRQGKLPALTLEEGNDVELLPEFGPEFPKA